MNNKITEVKLKLKKPLINYNGKTIKDSIDIRNNSIKYPTLNEDQILEKCPNMNLGIALPKLLLMIKPKDGVENLKLFRLSSKIYDKMLTSSGEMSVDLNQIVELYEYIEKIQNVPIITTAPILIYLDELKDKLK